MAAVGRGLGRERRRGAVVGGFWRGLVGCKRGGKNGSVLGGGECEDDGFGAVRQYRGGPRWSVDGFGLTVMAGFG